MLRAITCHQDTFKTIDNPQTIKEYLNDPQTTVWIDITGPGEAEIKTLREQFHFHPLSLEDVLRPGQRPKIEVYPTYYFMVFYDLDYSDQAASVQAHEIDIFLGKNYVVTVHEQPSAEIDEVWERWQRRADVIGSDVGALLYVLVDNLVDEYFPILDQLAERVEDVEQHIFEKFDKEALEDIFSLKKDLLALRRIISPERDVLNVLLRRDPLIVSAETAVFLQDVYDHILRVTDSLDTYRDLLSSALDAYLSVQSNNLNEIMRRLTVISTIFLPLTFLTGFFGMNFSHLPFDNDALLWASLGIMVMLPVAMLAYFRWRGLSD
ncbi:MAG: magnesium/cobalt transporter CorA [Anaerolineae bacterium]|nr:magnesium/cobalt transporter CorA [Anaerolineae bacterium]